jgi:hypothetical protein
MRKTSVVLALMISSVLLLQTPAWAPKLYRVTQRSGQTPSTANASLRTATVEADTDCDNQQVTLIFEWGEQRTATANANGILRVKATRIPEINGSVTIADVPQFRCDGVLAFTGAATTRLLVLGLILLAGGALLVVGSRRQGRVVTRRE